MPGLVQKSLTAVTSKCQLSMMARVAALAQDNPSPSRVLYLPCAPDSPSHRDGCDYTSAHKAGPLRGYLEKK